MSIKPIKENYNITPISQVRYAQYTQPIGIDGLKRLRGDYDLLNYSFPKLEVDDRVSRLSQPIKFEYSFMKAASYMPSQQVQELTQPAQEEQKSIFQNFENFNKVMTQISSFSIDKFLSGEKVGIGFGGDFKLVNKELAPYYLRYGLNYDENKIREEYLKDKLEGYNRQVKKITYKYPNEYLGSFGRSLRIFNKYATDKSILRYVMSPGDIFYLKDEERQAIKKYANTVGLNPDELIERIKQQKIAAVSKDVLDNIPKALENNDWSYFVSSGNKAANIRKEFEVGEVLNEKIPDWSREITNIALGGMSGVLSSELSEAVGFGGFGNFAMEIVGPMALLLAAFTHITNYKESKKINKIMTQKINLFDGNRLKVNIDEYTPQEQKSLADMADLIEEKTGQQVLPQDVLSILLIYPIKGLTEAQNAFSEIYRNTTSADTNYPFINIDNNM